MASSIRGAGKCPASAASRTPIGVWPASRTVVTPAARVRAQVGTELSSASDGGVMRMRTRLVPDEARWTCMSMKPGSSVRSLSSSTRAPAGIVSDGRAPAALIRPSSITTAARSIGSRPVPSMSRSATMARAGNAPTSGSRPEPPRATRASGGVSSEPLEVLAPVDVDGMAAGPLGGDRRDQLWVGPHQRAAADISLESVDVAPELTSQNNRWVEQPVEAERRRGQPRSRLGLEQAVDDLGADVGLIPQDDDGPSHVGPEAGDPGLQGCAHSLSERWIEDDAGTPQPDGSADRIGVGP